MNRQVSILVLIVVAVAAGYGAELGSLVSDLINGAVSAFNAIGLNFN